jgi:tripartite-type tricarboxylate transporter receptor subunit TctC
MRRSALAAACAALVGIGTAAAQPYPSHPITLIVPYAAGGPTDTLTRALTEAMRIAVCTENQILQYW